MVGWVRSGCFEVLDGGVGVGWCSRLVASGVLGPYRRAVGTRPTEVHGRLRRPMIGTTSGVLPVPNLHQEGSLSGPPNRTQELEPMPRPPQHSPTAPFRPLRNSPKPLHSVQILP